MPPVVIGLISKPQVGKRGALIREGCLLMMSNDTDMHKSLLALMMLGINTQFCECYTQICHSFYPEHYHTKT